MDKTYRIFTDGSAMGNPGPGGWGVVVIQGKERWEMSGAHPWTTISEMELVAAVQALRSVNGRTRIELQGLLKGFQGGRIVFFIGIGDSQQVVTDNARRMRF